MSVLARSKRQSAARPSRLSVPRPRPGSGRKLPSGLRETLSLERGERVLLTARDPEGNHVLVATDRALYHRDGGWSRSGWEQVAAVGWDSEAERLIISALSSAGSTFGGADSALTPHRTSMPLADRGAVPELANERITHSRLGRWPVPLPGGAQVIAEARRRPVTGELSWIVIPNGAAPANGAARAQVSTALARLSAELGFAPQLRPSPTPRIPRQ